MCALECEKNEDCPALEPVCKVDTNSCEGIRENPLWGDQLH